MSTTSLVIIVIICLMVLSLMTGIVGGYFLFGGRFLGEGSILDDLITGASDHVTPGDEVVPVSMSAPVIQKTTMDPASAPTIAPVSLSAPSTSSVHNRPSSQGDLSLDDFFTDFSVDAVNMPGDLSGTSNSMADTLAGEEVQVSEASGLSASRLPTQMNGEGSSKALDES